MKAIILAAGKGTRLGKYTKGKPKGMLKVFGKPLIESQIEIFRECGINDIVIVTGHMSDKIDFSDVKYYHNKDYETTNMVASLFCSENELEGNIIVSYADILFEKNVLNRLIHHPGSIVVTVDMSWEDYWRARFCSINVDTESLVLDDDKILELGEASPKKEKLNARYVGLIKFSKEGIEDVKKIYHQNEKIFQNAFMTDLLQALIDSKVTVNALKINHGWLEFDTIQDFERANELRRFLTTQ
jgi:choline kinase